MSNLTRSQKCPGNWKSRALVALALAMSAPVAAQKVATVEIAQDTKSPTVAAPVSIDLHRLTHVADSGLALVKVHGKLRTPQPFQIEDGVHGRKLTWIPTDQDVRARYELLAKPHEASGQTQIRAKKMNGVLTLSANGKGLLSYQFETMMPPTGVNEIFKRSAFIHPLRSPSGKVLTRVQPPDHYHHYGLWNPWTHVLFDGDTVDFWNLNAKQGTVRFSGFTSIIEGPVFGEYSAIHDHVAFKEGREQVAIRETQTVRVYAPNAGYYIVDITVSMNCPEKSVRLLEYRYGGMGWRATEQWTKENSRVLTSEGKTRKEADGSTARWCIVEGTTDGGNAGIVMMSHPSNYNHPEPLRIWPENSNRNRGDMFANFSPTKNMDWQLEPGKNYVLKYRFLVFDGEFNKAKAEAAWTQFASPPNVNVTRDQR